MAVFLFVQTNTVRNKSKTFTRLRQELLQVRNQHQPDFAVLL
jgi:hypothetical protein